MIAQTLAGEKDTLLSGASIRAGQELRTLQAVGDWFNNCLPQLQDELAQTRDALRAGERAQEEAETRLIQQVVRTRECW